MNVLLNSSTGLSNSRQLALHSQNDISVGYGANYDSEEPAEEKKIVSSSRIDRVLAEYGLPLRASVDTETRRSMRSCRESG